MGKSQYRVVNSFSCMWSVIFPNLYGKDTEMPLSEKCSLWIHDTSRVSINLFPQSILV